MNRSTATIMVVDGRMGSTWWTSRSSKSRLRRERLAWVCLTWSTNPRASSIMPSTIRARPKFRGAASGIFALLLPRVWKNWKIVNPKAISDSDVLTIDIKVRSLLIAVRSNDIAVLLAESSVEASPISSIGAFATSSFGMSI